MLFRDLTFLNSATCSWKTIIYLCTAPASDWTEITTPVVIPHIFMPATDPYYLLYLSIIAWSNLYAWTCFISIHFNVWNWKWLRQPLRSPFKPSSLKIRIGHWTQETIWSFYQSLWWQMIALRTTDIFSMLSMNKFITFHYFWFFGDIVHNVSLFILQLQKDKWKRRTTYCCIILSHAMLLCPNVKGYLYTAVWGFSQHFEPV